MCRSLNVGYVAGPTRLRGLEHGNATLAIARYKPYKEPRLCTLFTTPGAYVSIESGRNMSRRCNTLRCAQEGLAKVAQERDPEWARRTD
jgi:hypothetical protein